MPGPRTREELRAQPRDYAETWAADLRSKLAEAPFYIRSFSREGGDLGLDRVVLYDKRTHTFTPAYPKAGDLSSQQYDDLFMAAVEGRLYAYEAGSATPVRLRTDEQINPTNDQLEPVMTTAQPEPRHAPAFYKRLFGWLYSPWGEEVAEYDAFTDRETERSQTDLDHERENAPTAIDQMIEAEAHDKAAHDQEKRVFDQLTLTQRIDRLLGPHVEPIPDQLASRHENYPAEDLIPPQGFSDHDAAVIALVEVNNPENAKLAPEFKASADGVSAFIYENILKKNDPRSFVQYTPCMIRSRQLANEAMKEAANGNLTPLTDAFGTAVRTLMSNLCETVIRSGKAADLGVQIGMIMETAARVPGLIDNMRARNLIPEDTNAAIAFGQAMNRMETDYQNAVDEFQQAELAKRDPGPEKKREIAVALLTRCLVLNLMSRTERESTRENQELALLNLYHQYSKFTDEANKAAFIELISQYEPSGKPREDYLNKSTEELDQLINEANFKNIRLHPLRARLGVPAEMENIRRMIKNLPVVDALANGPLHRLNEMIASDARTYRCLAEGINAAAGKEAVQALEAFAAENRSLYDAGILGFSISEDHSVLAADIILSQAREEQASGLPGRFCQMARDAAAEGPITNRNRVLTAFMSTPIYNRVERAIMTGNKSNEYFEKLGSTNGSFAGELYKKEMAKFAPVVENTELVFPW